MSYARTHNERGFLSRLLHDARGNTIAIFTAAMIPLLGLIGGGVDMSRLYLTKTRVQQACDAGALAGRKAMGVNQWTTGTGSPEDTALKMFGGNFKQGDYGTGALTIGYSSPSDGSVQGAATVVVPMAVMKVFGIRSKTLSVSCTAKMAIPNTDVMFVLDVTGSMSCPPGTTTGGCSITSSSKISGLKKAVKCFYEALEKVNTIEACTYNSSTKTYSSTSDPTASSYAGTTQIRIGFVPYSVNVNVGKLLPNDYLADSWKYQSRQPAMYTPGTATIADLVNETATYKKSSDCDTWAKETTYQGFPADAPNSFTGTTYTHTWVSYNSSTNTCTRSVKSSTATYTRDDTNGTYFYQWIYRQQTFNVSSLKAGAGNWNSSVSLRVGSGGTYTSVTWDGCIEERKTHPISDTNPTDDFATIPSDAYDLDIDMVPSSDTNTKWGPLLYNAVWERGNTTDDVYSSSDLSRPNTYYCPVAAKKLAEWKTANPFVTYVDSLAPLGNTYHDIGMIWGARFISPSGIFATENNNVTNIQRHLIFMTDGDTNTNLDDYSAYGLNWWDRRQTTYEPSKQNQDDILNARLTALCTAIKNKNITLWVVSYGGDVSATTENRLKACATSATTTFFSAADTPTLINSFKGIADKIAQLRLTN
jgi:Flp pilus assembly protein TadG